MWSGRRQSKKNGLEKQWVIVTQSIQLLTKHRWGNVQEKKNLYKSSANGLNASECEMEINWSIHSTAANYMWQGRQTPEFYGAQRKTALIEKFEGCLLPLWGMTFDPVRECCCHWIVFNSAIVWSLYFKSTELGLSLTAL